MMAQTAVFTAPALPPDAGVVGAEPGLFALGGQLAAVQVTDGILSARFVRFGFIVFKIAYVPNKMSIPTMTLVIIFFAFATSSVVPIMYM